MKAPNSKTKVITEEDASRAKRIKDLMRAKNLQQTDLSDLTGATRGAVSKWTTGFTVPSGDYLVGLALALNTTPEWIINGDGDALGSAQPQPDTLFKVPVCEEVETVSRLSLVRTDKYIQINTDIAKDAGASIIDTYCYVNKSDSMFPKVNNGAECLVDASKKDIKEGKVYLIECGVLLMLRTIYKRHDGGLLLRAANNEYDDLIIEPKNLNEIKTLGWVYRVANLERW